MLELKVDDTISDDFYFVYYCGGSWNKFRIEYADCEMIKEWNYEETESFHRLIKVNSDNYFKLVEVFVLAGVQFS